MELQFNKTTVSCLDPVLREVQNMELTQELRLGDSMPDVGHVLCAWGQPVLRSKEWRMDSVSFSAGLMVWVLYAPEDGSGEVCIDGWIPFQMKWDLPEGTPEGSIRIRCLPRFVDARAVSPRKLLVRAGVGAMGEAFAPREAELYQPGEVPESVQLLRHRYPIQLLREAGEKTFLLDESLSLPADAAGMEQVVCWRFAPKLTETKVLGSRVVFRGSGNLHLLCREEGGRLRGRDLEFPFSHFAELDREYGPDARGDLALCPTNLDLELGEQGQPRLKGEITAQYLITDKQLLELVKDAYSPGQELKAREQTLELPTVLETRRENLYGEQTISAEAEQMADAWFLPDFPRMRRGEAGLDLDAAGQFQTLYYGENGVLRSGSARWEGKQSIPADSGSEVMAVPVPGEPPQGTVGSGQLRMTGEFPMALTVTARERIPMVTGLELGELTKPDPGRPSLILRRMGENGLWDMAKESHSTVDAIRRANGLQEEPLPGQMLLIPVL